MSKSAAAETITSSSGTTFKKPEREISEGDAITTYVRLGQLAAGATVVEGIYMGSSQNKMYPEKLDFQFKTIDGKDVVVNEGGNLKFRLSKIAAGTLVMIKYEGKQKITSGPRAGKEAHNVEVLVAE